MRSHLAPMAFVTFLYNNFCCDSGRSAAARHRVHGLIRCFVLRNPFFSTVHSVDVLFCRKFGFFLVPSHHHFRCIAYDVYLRPNVIFVEHHKVLKGWELLDKVETWDATRSFICMTDRLIKNRCRQKHVFIYVKNKRKAYKRHRRRLRGSFYTWLGRDSIASRPRGRQRPYSLSHRSHMETKSCVFV